MRTRIAAAITALALLLFPLGAFMIVSRSFDLTMERERERALSEEAAIARAVAMEVSGGTKDQLFSAASSLQNRYGSNSLSVMLVYHGQAMAGAQIPQTQEMEELIETDARATLLDGDSRSLLIAHRLSDGITLLLESDVSGVYALRRELSVWAGLLCAAGVALCALLTLLLASDVSAVYALRGELAVWAGALSLAGVALSALLAVVVSGWLSRPYKLLASQRQELIDAMAHEMRTPLTAILGGVRLLERAKLPDESRDALLSTMAREAQRLTDMDERLLLLTRLEHGKAAFTRFSSMEMAREALSVFEGVELTGEDAQFHAERELTVELLRNLVVNAQRAGGSEPVRVRMCKDGFSVEDRGCGMTKEQIARAFEPFYRADKSRARAAGGAGLGLTLCRKIAKLHGGELSIISRPGEGTCVVYEFDTSR